jgi:hypothetical protein
MQHRLDRLDLADQSSVMKKSLLTRAVKEHCRSTQEQVLIAAGLYIITIISKFFRLKVQADVQLLQL